MSVLCLLLKKKSLGILFECIYYSYDSSDDYAYTISKGINRMPDNCCWDDCRYIIYICTKYRLLFFFSSNEKRNLCIHDTNERVHKCISQHALGRGIHRQTGFYRRPAIVVRGGDVCSTHTRAHIYIYIYIL
jgi:hypothetical protein